LAAAVRPDLGTFVVRLPKADARAGPQELGPGKFATRSSAVFCTVVSTDHGRGHSRTSARSSSTRSRTRSSPSWAPAARTPLRPLSSASRRAEGSTCTYCWPCRAVRWPCGGSARRGRRRTGYLERRQRMRRLRRGWTPPASPVRPRMLDEDGRPITFAAPGNPAVEERRRYALAVQRATTPVPLTSEQEAARAAELRRRREVLQRVGVYVNE
jgi:hypothetical protein